MSDDQTNVALLDALQRANPVPVDSVADRRDLPSAHALFAEITMQPPRRVRRRRLILAITLLGLAVASVLGAFAAVDRTDQPNPTQPALCYERADRESPTIVAPSTDLESCAQLWGMEGGFRGPAPTAFDRCLLPTGAVGIFPGESGSICDDLGLPSVRTTSYGVRVAAASDATGLALLRQCKTREPGTVVAYDDAVAVVEGILAEHDITDWTTRPGDHILRPAEPCASPAFDEKNKTVVIQAIDWGIEGGAPLP